MTATDAKRPEHEAIYQRIRDMILFGEVAPGQGVTILGLTEKLGAGMTPVREAIRRLTAEGALEAQGNRRVIVPVMTLEKLDQIEFARLSIEPRLAEIAAQKQGPGLVSDLRALDAQVDAAIEVGSVEQYLEQNYRFHFRLYAEARASILQKIALSLWLQAGPSLRIVCGRYGTSNLPDKHDEAMAALAAGDAAGAAQAISEDIRQGLDQVRATLARS
ncbi:GntR family transcriptional regulator [Actibacterium sp. MT2.3-13A]|uniref:GntR family transcriptional regulator n=1 Tax=Actibacterium sp. MT2.3-13A TaxID=2828332 RepID=UPI001BAB057D